MSFFALALVLSSACLHATWNLLAKRAKGGAEFSWLFAALTAIIYAPVAIGYALYTRQGINGLQFSFIVGSAAIHVGYYLSLQRGYRAGDLSLVYPLARGTGPMLATIAAILLLGERPTALALCGTVFIVISVFLLTGGFDTFKGNTNRTALGYGLLTGLFIATYTVWDGYSVGVLGTAPLLFMWLSETVRSLLLSPIAFKNWGKVRLEWREHRKEAFGIAILSPLAYIMVLTALVFTPISYVAPTREVSILIGAIIGAQFLGEGDVKRRLIAASGMVLGVAMLALN